MQTPEAHLVEDRKGGVEVLLSKVLDLAAAAWLLFAESVAREGQLQSTCIPVIDACCPHLQLGT